MKGIDRKETKKEMVRNVILLYDYVMLILPIRILICFHCDSVMIMICFRYDSDMLILMFYYDSIILPLYIQQLR